MEHCRAQPARRAIPGSQSAHKRIYEHIPTAARNQLACDPVDTRIRTNVEKRGEGLTVRGDGGPALSNGMAAAAFCRLTPGIARELVSRAVQRCEKVQLVFSSWMQ